MNSLLPRTSLKCSPRTRIRKDGVVEQTPSRSSSLRRKTRPPPLQIIPELSENEFDLGNPFAHSPATARPIQYTPRPSELESSRITLSAYTFSIDDALLMLGDDTPSSPALSASSSTSDGTTSEDVPSTPATSDDEGICDYALPAPRLRPQRISIRPLCITKTRSLVCQDDDDIHDHLEKADETPIPLPVIVDPFEQATGVQGTPDIAQETEQDFYIHEFEDFISLSPVFPSPASSARRDSLTLSAEMSLADAGCFESKSRGRSRLSKPLPLLPLVTPSTSFFPFNANFSLVQTTAQTSVVRRKRNASSLPNCPAPLPAFKSRPLPRTAIPLDIEDSIFPEDGFDVPLGPIIIEQVYSVEDTNIYSQSTLGYRASTSSRPLPPAVLETPLVDMYGEIALPRASIDSDAPRSSIDSALSFASSTLSNTPLSPFSFPSTPSDEFHETESSPPLRSRWSCSTLASLDVEPTRSSTLLSPLRNVFGSRARRTPPPQKTPPRTPPQAAPSKSRKNKRGSPKTSSPPSTLPKGIRRQRSRSSVSSGGTSSTECEGRDGSPSGLRRKPIPVSMFLRST